MSLDIHLNLAREVKYPEYNNLSILDRDLGTKYSLKQWNETFKNRQILIYDPDEESHLSDSISESNCIFKANVPHGC